jgi:hypothetical protein
MATEAATIEAARTRIQRLVEQIAALAKAEISSEEFFAKFLERVTRATDARGGALWLTGSRPQDNKSHFQLCAHVDLASSLFTSDESQRTSLLNSLTEVIRSNKPLILNPANPAPAGDSAPPPTAAPVNKTPYAFLHIPLHLNSQAIGILQVWLQPGVQARSFPEFVTFLGSLAPCLEQHLQSRRPGNLLLETQRLRQLLRFTTDLAGALDPLDIARITANHARDLAGCERASLLVRERESWKLLAISGYETLQPESPTPAFVQAHVAAEPRILEKKQLLERAGILSALICPIIGGEKEITGALLCESTFEGYFDSPVGISEVSTAKRVTELVSTHAGLALATARHRQFLPSSLRRLTDHKRYKRLLKPALSAALPLLLLLYPARRQVEGDCSIQALHRAIVAPAVSARIETILVREGDHVTKGQPLAQLDTRHLRLPADIDSATLRSPIDGTVMTRDLDLRSGELLKEGAPFIEIDDLTSWQLHTRIDERHIAAVEQALQKGPLDLTYILSSQSDRLDARLDSPRQISPSAFLLNKQNVFLLTIDNPPIPADISTDIRPGLTGRAELELGRQPLLFTLLRSIYRWCQFR